MPNIAALLKSEISRVARREVRSVTSALKSAVGVYRSEIAALKRRTEALERQLRRQSRLTAKLRSAAPEPEGAGPQALRFSAKGLAAQRQRLGLSAHDCGLLVGASSQSVYNWETGKVRPRATHLAAIAALRGLGKREVTARLAALRAST